jgi:transposase
MLRILDVTLQTRSTTHTGVRRFGVRGLNVQNLVQKSVTKKRRIRLYDSSFSEIRRILEWQFLKRGKLVLTVPAYS